MTQAEIILDHLIHGEVYSTYRAYAEHKITTCGQRITDLRKLGWRIKSEKAKDGPHHEYTLEHCWYCQDNGIGTNPFWLLHVSGTIEHPIKKEAA